MGPPRSTQSMPRLPHSSNQGVSSPAQAARPVAWAGSLGAPLALLALVGAGVAFTRAAPGRAPLGAALHAGTTLSVDLDLDGLTNEAEWVLGTQEGISDTDADGFSDLEEFARGSDPRSAISTPLPASLGLNMSASGEPSGLHVQIALYYTDDDLSNKQLHVGIVAGGEVRFLPALLQQPGVRMVRRAAAGVTDDVLLVDVPVAESFVQQNGDASVFAALSIDGQPGFVAAAGVDLLSRDGITLLLQRPKQRRVARASFQGVGSQGPGNSGPSSGAIYMPITPGGGGLPSTWNPGEICYQATIEVGSIGGIVSHEVIAADCVEGWDAHCRSDCSSSVGEVFQTFDPLGLVGS